MLKIGLFGVGHLGKIHLSQLTTMKDVEVVGFFDPSDANAASIAQYNLTRYNSPEELIQLVDAVDIVAPTTHHFNLCELAIRNGKHIFVEKPMTNTMDEAKTLVKLVDEANIKFQVGHVERFNPAYLSLQGYDLKPMFIEVHRLAEFNPRGTDVSVILDLMIHDIDIVLSIVKSSINRISASGVAVMSDTPDIANVRIEFHNGCVANLTSSRISLKKMRKMRLFQKDAYISVDFLEKKAEVIRMKDAPENPTPFDMIIENAEGEKNQILFEYPNIQPNNAILDELNSFADAITNGKNVEVSLEDGTEALKVALEIMKLIS